MEERCLNTRDTASLSRMSLLHVIINLLTPNVYYSVRTAPLSSEVTFYIFIQQI